MKTAFKSTTLLTALLLAAALSPAVHAALQSRLSGQAVYDTDLRMLNNAQQLDDLRIPPANRLEALKSSRKGQHSIRINDQWRICFRWKNGNCGEVGIVDYH